jgi:hypothetical protein
MHDSRSQQKVMHSNAIDALANFGYSYRNVFTGLALADLMV